ncbi:MAG: DUF58 domain-containing protein [Bacteroidales bacterium]|nr:DUF58 domain-containing protein [Bacteroidales bacterium]
MKNPIKSIYILNRFYFAIGVLIVLFIFGNYSAFIFASAKALLLLFVALILIDVLLLYNSSEFKIKAERKTPKKLSNGDKNKITIYLKNNYRFSVKISIIDEIPHQFQKRNFLINRRLVANQEKNITYILRPVKRGNYIFGKLNIYVSSVIGLIQRRFTFNEGQEVPVYPSFIQLRKYELLAISNRLTEAGIKKIRKISNNNEFDQIKNYVKGDDFRTINWKATARKSGLMVNQYQDEKAQRIYSIIDMGRTMKMPFNKMSLLDYSINAALVISNIAIYKHDKAGLITFSKGIHSILPANRKNSQMFRISELLYKQKTNYAESNIELLYATIKRKLRQRSLLLIYTNFEGLVSLERQLQYFKQLAKSHLVVCIFFENSELKEITENRPKDTEDVYIKTIAEKFAYEKRLIVKELKKHGVHSILTEPKNLTVNTINKYLEFKALGMI